MTVMRSNFIAILGARSHSRTLVVRTCYFRNEVWLDELLFAVSVALIARV